MVNYPTSLDNDSTLYLVADNVDDYLAIHHNALKDAVVALETVVGITGAFNFADVSHAMTSHSDDDSYNISTAGTFAFGAAAEDLDMGGFDITGIVQLVASTTAEAKIEMFETNAVNEGSAYLQMGVSDNNKWIMQGYHDGAGDLTELRITTTSIGGASAAGFGDIVFLPDTVEKMRLQADGILKLSGNLNLQGNSLYGTNFSLGNAELNWLEDIYDTGVTSTEFDYLDGNTGGNIQTQIDGKLHANESTYVETVACNLIA